MDVMKCSPIVMRKNIEVAECLRNAGIDFVCVPAKNEQHKNELILLGEKILGEMADYLEKNQ